MNLRTISIKLAVLVVLCIVGYSGCVPAPSQPSVPDYNANAEYADNVSTMYHLGSVPSDGSVIDIQWRDSLGYVRSLADDSAKAIVVTFWSTSDSSARLEIAAVDSIAKVMGDSVKVVGVAVDNTIHSFITVYSYVTANKLSTQIVVDSNRNAFREYLELVDDQNFYNPETFIFKPHGAVASILQGNFSFDDILADTRQAWQ